MQHQVNCQQLQEQTTRLKVTKTATISTIAFRSNCKDFIAVEKTLWFAQNEMATSLTIASCSDETVLLNTFVLSKKYYRVLFYGGEVVWESEKSKNGKYREEVEEEGSKFVFFSKNRYWSEGKDWPFGEVFTLLIYNRL